MSQKTSAFPHQRRENVLQKADASLRDALLRHVAVAVLEDGPAPELAARAARTRRAAASAGGNTNQTNHTRNKTYLVWILNLLSLDEQCHTDCVVN